MSRDSQSVPFFRPSIGEEEIAEVLGCLRSGWLTTGPRVRQFEQTFANATGGSHAIALNSCTAALHLAVEALGLRPGQAVLVPTMTFAATAEVVRYQGAVPLLVDCDRRSLNMDLSDAVRRIDDLRKGKTPLDPTLEIVGMMPVHVAGAMLDMDEVSRFASERGLWVVEDAAHAFPAAYRTAEGEWRRCGDSTADVTCFSFYANKTITTGEGGMAVTSRADLAERIRRMSLHGLSHDAWKRYSGGGWDYRITAPGYKYNMTDLAAAIGVHQVDRAEELRRRREEIALRYMAEFADLDLELPETPLDRIHSRHLFAVRVPKHFPAGSRDQLIADLRDRGIGTSVHWRPLHLHPYYQETFGWREHDLPVATAEWARLVSLPLFPAMTETEIDYTINGVKEALGIADSHPAKSAA